MFTPSQSKKVWKGTVGVVLIAALLATVYSLVFGNPGAAWWASLFIFPFWVITILWSGAISSSLQRVIKPNLLSLGIGVFVSASLSTVGYLLFLRLIRELDDTMYIEGFPSLAAFAWVLFYSFAGMNFIFYFVLWGLWSIIKLGRRRFTRNQVTS